LNPDIEVEESDTILHCRFKLGNGIALGGSYIGECPSARLAGEFALERIVLRVNTNV
jgi:hypothetical protein